MIVRPEVSPQNFRPRPLEKPVHFPFGPLPTPQNLQFVLKYVAGHWPIPGKNINFNPGG